MFVLEPRDVISKHNGQIPLHHNRQTEGSMAKHIIRGSIRGKLHLLLLLILAVGISGLGFAQDGKQGAPPQEPPKGQGPGPKSGGQSGGGASTGIGIDVGQVIGLFRHHAKSPAEANTQQTSASGVWQKSLPPNQVKSEKIAVHNGCNRPERFEVMSQPFPAFMQLSGERDLEVTAQGLNEFLVQFNTNGLKEGEYDGALVVRCVTCKKPCIQTNRVLNVHLTVLALVAKVPENAPNGSPNPIPPTKTPEPTKTTTPQPTVIPPAATPAVAPVPASASNGEPTHTALDKAPEQTKTVTPSPTPVPRVSAPEIVGTNQALANTSNDHPQSQSAKGTGTQSTVPTEAIGQTTTTGTTSTTEVQSGTTTLSYNVSLLADSRIETGKPLNLTAQIFPDLPPGKSAQYCFSWGDGNTRECQASPAAVHIYGLRGKYSASVEVFVEQEKLASAIQIDAVMPLRTKLLLILAVILALLVAASGIHKARKMIKAAVSVHASAGTHKIEPQLIERSEGLCIRCVRTSAVSKIVFTPPSPLPQENKETANV